MIISNPKKLFEVAFKDKENKELLKYRVISEVILMIRHFQVIDKLHIQKLHLNGVKDFISYDYFHFNRTFETIKDFSCSQNPKK